jgi:predicted AAA+ superfamily ATPase
MSGVMLETYVVAEIVKCYHHNGLFVSFYFYRDRDNKEIDLLIERNGLLYPIEIKRSASPKIDDIKHFDVLSRLGKPSGKGAVICLYDKFLPLNHQTNIIPVSYI